MKDEIELKEIIADGRDADSWINHPKYKKVIVSIKAELIHQFEKTKFKDSDERDEIWRKIQSLNSIVNRMERMVRDGENAKKDLLQLIKDKFKK